MINDIFPMSQTGFTSGRSFFNNILNCLALIDEALTSSGEYISIFIDFERVYDRLARDYILVVLKAYGDGNFMT